MWYIMWFFFSRTLWFHNGQINSPLLSCTMILIWDEFWQRQTVVSIHKLIISIIVQESNGEFICRLSSKKNVASDLNGKWTDKGLQKCSAVWQQCRQYDFSTHYGTIMFYWKKNQVIYHIFTRLKKSSNLTQIGHFGMDLKWCTKLDVVQVPIIFKAIHQISIKAHIANHHFIVISA